MFNRWAFCIALCLMLNTKTYSESYTIYSIEAPPLTMLNSQQAGIVGDIVLEAFHRLGHTVKVETLPWKRAQRLASQGDNQFIMPLALLPSREQHFTWVAYIMTLERSFASTQIPINSYQQAREQVHKIGVGQGSAQATILQNKNYKKDQVVEIKIGKAAAEMLQRGRIDAWFNGTPESVWYWNQQYPKQPLIVGDPVESNQLFLAASKNVDPILVQQLALTIQQLHDEGFVKRTEQHYLGAHAKP
ncbi:substrate-binding periplasmic protein [Agarivorans sp. Toyoura001]|uniref:substrate-binding periplasmic protein n=1 Tax=unclassified Agarivorans TaxID=2636026 RepID=UPI0010E29984|nr:ABC transporter substrate-binding protein [Agarivorans sp. Toyoura001]GDY26912.1 hypothetical protein AHAT_28020 [Agarivorans sp. Toyoura001]